MKTKNSLKKKVMAFAPGFYRPPCGFPCAPACAPACGPCAPACGPCAPACGPCAPPCGPCGPVCAPCVRPSQISKAFAQLFSTNAQVVLTNATVVFNSLNSPSPVITVASNAATVLVPGYYLISGDVTQTQNTSGIGNPAVVGFSISGATPTQSFTTGASATSLHFQQIINLSAGATVAIMNISPSSASLTMGSNNGAVNASLTILQL